MALWAEDGFEPLRKAFHSDDANTVRRMLESDERAAQLAGEFGSTAVTLVQSREMLDVLLDFGADINARTDWWAGGFGILDTVDPSLANYAIERGAIVDAHSASRLGYIETLKALVAADPGIVHARGGDGQTPLHFASTVEIADFLLDHGADIDALDVDHVSTPAQYMVRSRQAIARHLVSRGGKVDLLMASAFGHLGLVRDILDRQPESIHVRVSDEDFPMISQVNGGTIYQWELGWYVSPHQVALEFGHKSVYDLLVERSPLGTRLVNACRIGDKAMADSLMNSTPELVSELTPADTRQVAHAARNNDLTAVRLMLGCGLPVMARSQHRATTLHWAAWHGNADMVTQILDYEPVIDDCENDYGSTPLGWAVYASEHGWNPAAGDYGATARALIEAGSPVPSEPSGSAEVRAVLGEYGR